VVFALVLWGFMGVSVTALYRGLDLLYGDGRGSTTLHLIITLTKKSLTDQLLFSAFYGAPIVAITHYWRDRGYKFSAVREMLASKGWFRRLIIPTLVMSWTIWTPSLFVVYSLPLSLQPQIGGLVNGFWSLMCLQIAARTK
jgi:hypothetical protein